MVHCSSSTVRTQNDEMQHPEEILVKSWIASISIFLLVWRRQAFFFRQICQCLAIFVFLLRWIFFGGFDTRLD